MVTCLSHKISGGFNSRTGRVSTYWKYELIFVRPDSTGSTIRRNTYYEADSYQDALSVAKMAAEDWIDRTSKTRFGKSELKSMKVERA